MCFVNLCLCKYNLINTVFIMNTIAHGLCISHVFTYVGVLYNQHNLVSLISR